MNPVTGQRELGLVSLEQQIAIGKQQYVPAQQMQGGRYQVEPELSAYVNSVGQKVAAYSPVDLPWEFVVLNNSVPNAWALPGGKIAVNRGLLTELKNEAELAAVLGHEAVHAAARHGARAMERGLLLQGALLAAAVGTRNSEYAGSVLGAGQLAAGLLTQRYGRDAERESDFYGTEFMAQAGYDPYAAVTLQETFVRLAEGRSNGARQSWLEGLFASHPPSTERVANNKSIVNRLKETYPQANRFGADDYQRAIAPLRRDADAYAAYDAARKAFAEGDLDTALTETNRAISAQDREALFHSLRGDIRYKQGRFDDARTNYDRAVERDPEYFAHFIGRGMSLKKTGNAAAAKADLQRSLELLPTAVAYNALGEIAEAQGDKDSAVRYYQAAAEAQSDVGRTAFGNLLRVDVPRQPARYIQAQIRQDERQRLVLQVANATSAPLADIQIQVELLRADGSRQRFSADVPRLGANATELVLVPGGGAGVVNASAYAVSARVVQ